MNNELLTASSPAVVAIVAGIQSIFDLGALGAGAFTVEVSEGPRHLKLIRKNASPSSGLTRSAYAFIDRRNGDLLKAASWASPAKGARGNIHAPDALRTATPYGFGYAR